MTRTVMWAFMTFLAVGVALYALAAALAPGLRTPFVEDMLATSFSGATLHFLAGAVVIIAGALQFNSWIRKNHLSFHRWCGRVYVVGVLIGGVAGLYLAFNSFGGVVTHFGFGMLAVGWLFSTTMAYTQIRARNIRGHQEWMIRSYAFTLGAVTLRLYLPLFAMAGVPFEEGYQAIAWLAWVPNILIAEWFLISRQRAVSAIPTN